MCVCAHNLFPGAKDCYLVVIQMPVCISRKKTGPKPTYVFPAKFNDPQVYISKVPTSLSLSFLLPVQTHSSVCRLYLKRRRRKMVKLVKYWFVLFFPSSPDPLLPSPPPTPTSLQVYGNTLPHENSKSEETSRHYGLLKVLKDNTAIM